LRFLYGRRDPNTGITAGENHSRFADVEHFRLAGIVHRDTGAVEQEEPDGQTYQRIVCQRCLMAFGHLHRGDGEPAIVYDVFPGYQMNFPLKKIGWHDSFSARFTGCFTGGIAQSQGMDA